MGLFLNKNANGDYRRTWYATIFRQGKKTTQALRTPLHGKIPVDANGRFSLQLTGDTAFEKSKAAAQAEFDAILSTAKEMKAEERKSPGYAEREAYRKTTGKVFEIPLIAELAEKNATRNRYALTGDKQADRYNQSVFDILTHFARWCEASAVDRQAPLVKLTDISRAVVTAYYTDLTQGNPDLLITVKTKTGAVTKSIEPLSWQSFRKYVFILASVYRYFMPKNVENPFEKVYEDAYKGKKTTLDKTSVVHEAPTNEQIHRLWDVARQDNTKPYLHRLAVLAACTGMRIGDCCNLTWNKVDLLNYRLTTKTLKTGKNICVPIFDYDPSSDDYHPLLGELRRELEAALTERKKSPYVIPEAAALYKDDPTRINKLGKTLFARALFSDPEAEEAVLVGEERPQKSPAEILRQIEDANMQTTKKERLIRVYELHVQGRSCGQIAAALGKRKGSVSEDLACIEDLTGEKIRVGNPYMGANAKPGLRELLKKTRSVRGQGQRAACLYGWHSCRVFFVVTAIDAGIRPDDLRLIVGHATVSMVLHYYNPEELIAAEKMRAQLRRKRTAALPPPPPAPATANTALLAATIQSILTNPDLTPEARNAAILALTGKC